MGKYKPPKEESDVLTEQEIFVAQSGKGLRKTLENFQMIVRHILGKESTRNHQICGHDQVYEKSLLHNTYFTAYFIYLHHKQFMMCFNI